MRNRFFKIILWKVLILNLALSLVGCSMFGRRTEETPKYQVLEKSENLEIREYASYIEATTAVKGGFKDSQGEAFRILANYIFGDNEKQSKISMTAPVVMNPNGSSAQTSTSTSAASPNESEKISMTAPVVQSPTQDGWQMSFSMPSKFKSIEDLPRPKDPRIRFNVVPPKTIAVIQFSGLWSEQRNREMAQQLKRWLLKSGQYKTVSEPMFAGYDPPWTLPFFRRNEMMIEVKKLP